MSAELESGGPITPKKLRWIADYFDLADKAIEALARLGDRPLKLGDGVQRDLRRWADEMEAQ